MLYFMIVIWIIGSLIGLILEIGMLFLLAKFSLILTIIIGAILFIVDIFGIIGIIQLHKFRQSLLNTLNHMSDRKL